MLEIADNVFQISVSPRNAVTTWPGLHEPPTRFTHDIAKNRESIRKIAALKPRVIGFGHGPAFRDADELMALAGRLG